MLISIAGISVNISGLLIVVLFGEFFIQKIRSFQFQQTIKKRDNKANFHKKLSKMDHWSIIGHLGNESRVKIAEKTIIDHIALLRSLPNN